MTDPLNDPRFPKRPNHPDFWRISESVLQLDGAATEGGKSFEEITDGLVDADSLGYMAQGRANLALGGSPAALWMDGFVTALLFAQKGGHRE